MHADLDLAGAGDRLVDVREMQHVGRAISFEAQRLHQRLTRIRLACAPNSTVGRRVRTCSIGSLGTRRAPGSALREQARRPKDAPSAG